MKSWHHRLRVT